MSPKPVTSVQAFTPTFIMASDASRFRVAITATAFFNTSGGEVPAFAPVVMMPVPMGLVSTKASPGRGVGVGDLLARFHQPHYGQSVLRLFVVHGVSADDETAGFRRLVVTAPEHVAQQFAGQGSGEPDHVEGQQGACAHGVDVAQGIGGRHQAELVGVVGNGRKEVHGHDQSGLVVQPVDGGVVAGVDAHQQVGVAYHGQFL